MSILSNLLFPVSPGARVDAVMTNVEPRALVQAREDTDARLAAIEQRTYRLVRDVSDLAADVRTLARSVRTERSAR